jgi:hypothetical protein
LQGVVELFYLVLLLGGLVPELGVELPDLLVQSSYLGLFLGDGIF